MKYLIFSLFCFQSLVALPRVPFTQVAKSNNEFAIALFRELVASRTSNQSNFVFANYTLSASMAIAYLGARGNTERDIASFFFYPLTPNYLGESFKRLNNDLTTDPGLGLASSVWVQSGLNLKEDFKTRVDNYYEGQFHEVDFARMEDSARFEINGWVSKKTEKKIPYLLSVSDVPRNNKLFLIAVATLQSVWENPFSTRDTATEKFFVSKTIQTSAPMMKIKGAYPLFQNDEVKVIEIPFLQRADQTSKVGFWVVIPKEVDGLKQLEQNLSAKQYNEWVTMAVRKNVSVKIPRFRMNQIINFKDVLERVGLTTPFSSEADFSGMSDASGLYISKIFQKCFFMINEKGSDPRTQTSIPRPLPNVEEDLGDTEEFFADRPFLFFVYDNTLGQMLFMGHCIQP